MKEWLHLESNNRAYLFWRWSCAYCKNERGGRDTLKNHFMHTSNHFKWTLGKTAHCVKVICLQDQATSCFKFYSVREVGDCGPFFRCRIYWANTLVPNAQVCIQDWNTQTSPSCTNNHATVSHRRHIFSPFLMFDVVINWHSVLALFFYTALMPHAD